MKLYICDICEKQDVNCMSEDKVSVHIHNALVAETQPKMRCPKCRAILFDRARKFIKEIKEI